jgi:hypothetical protein
MQAKRQIWCGRPNLNRHGVAPDAFSHQLRFSPPPLRAFVVWTIPSPWRLRAVGAARLVSTSSSRTFVPRLGSESPSLCRSKASPSLSSSASRVSPQALKLRSSPLRLPIPPRPLNTVSYSGRPANSQGQTFTVGRPIRVLK